MRKHRSKEHVTRAFAVGNLEFTVSTSNVDDRKLVEALFRDLPSPHSPARKPASFSLARTVGEDHAWVVSSPRLQGQRSTTVDGALVLLVSEVNLCSLDAEAEFLHLHAAAATKAGGCVVIAAERGTGKTTTVANLVARGWDFVTDETARLGLDPSQVTGFPKPLSIKPGSFEILEHLTQWAIPPTTEPSTFRFVPIGATGATVVEGGPARLVILLKRPWDDPLDAEPVVRRLHPADATVGLMQETLDAQRYGSAALRLAQLSASAACYELTIGEPDATVDEIEALFELGAPEPLVVRPLPSSVAFSPGVTSLSVGDRVVVHDVESGRIFALDPGGARVWSQLAGWSAGGDQVDIEGPVIASFVAQLRTLGVLAGAT